MLVPMVETMTKAKIEGYCVPALSGANELSLRAVVAAGEAMNSPIIVLVKYSNVPDIREFGRMATHIADQAKIPVSIILDHGSSFEECVACIRAGFSDVMLDRSSEPYAKNAAEVAEVVHVAHAVGVGVEAELGHVGEGDKYDQEGNTVFTVPDEAVRFVEETGCDTLAVAVGTSHGVYKGEPKINFELLQELHEKVPVPLVIHGGSGTGDDNLRKLCRLGANKLNIAHDLYDGAIDAVRTSDLSGFNAYRVFAIAQEGYKKAAMAAIELCGSVNKA